MNDLKSWTALDVHEATAEAKNAANIAKASEHLMKETADPFSSRYALVAAAQADIAAQKSTGAAAAAQRLNLPIEAEDARTAAVTASAAAARVRNAASKHNMSRSRSHHTPPRILALLALCLPQESRSEWWLELSSILAEARHEERRKFILNYIASGPRLLLVTWLERWRANRPRQRKSLPS